MTEKEEIEELRKLRDYWKRAAENAHQHCEALEEENDSLKATLARIRKVKRYSMHVVSEFGYAPRVVPEEDTDGDYVYWDDLCRA
jgi:DNA repair exonuclease SbcCD ATPase subunit